VGYRTIQALQHCAARTRPIERRSQTLLMLYLIAVVLPPLAVLLCGKPFQALLSLPLTLLGWAPGVIHAMFVVNNHYADQRADRMVRAMDTRRF
jgi:uncharacterized membrane protein YqaE (UPF0057 family)